MTESPVTISSVSGRDLTSRRLLAIWAKILCVESLEVDQNFFDLGGDSSLAVQLFAQIDRTFGIKLPLAALYEAPTVEELARILDGAAALSSGWSPLVAIQPLGTLPPLFCFHGAGGNVLNYRRLSQLLGPEQPFYGLQCQGLDGTSPLLTTIEEMASLYIQQLRRVQAHGPYFLAGYCLGGTIAYEVAQQLHAAGERVALLALLDTMNWHKVPLTRWSKASYSMERLVFHAANFLQPDSTGRAEFIGEKIEVLRSRVPVWRGALLSSFNRGIPREKTSIAMALAKIWQTNDRAAWSYVPRTYPGVVVDVRPARQYRMFKKPGLKWDELAQGGQHVIVLPVYPAGMLVEPFVQDLAVALGGAIHDAVRAVRSQSAG